MFEETKVNQDYTDLDKATTSARIYNYIAQYMENSQVVGYNCDRHFEALEYVKALSKQIEDLCRNDPRWVDYLEYRNSKAQTNE